MQEYLTRTFPLNSFAASSKVGMTFSVSFDTAKSKIYQNKERDENDIRKLNFGTRKFLLDDNTSASSQHDLPVF